MNQTVARPSALALSFLLSFIFISQVLASPGFDFLAKEFDRKQNEAFEKKRKAGFELRSRIENAVMHEMLENFSASDAAASETADLKTLACKSSDWDPIASCVFRTLEGSICKTGYLNPVYAQEDGATGMRTREDFRGYSARATCVSKDVETRDVSMRVGLEEAEAITARVR